MAPVPASARIARDVTVFATGLSISNIASCHVNCELLHSPVIEGVTNLTMLLFHFGGGGGGGGGW